MLDPDAPATLSAQTVRALPGLALSIAVAVAALALAPVLVPVLPIPAMVLALFIGMAINPLAARPVFQPGLLFCVKDLLRCAVALLGLRIALGDIVALGLVTALVVVVSMMITIVSGFLFARIFGQPAPYGALAGAGTAVCGASATLATATVLPSYRGKEADVVFVVVAVNALSTAAMVLYPPLCHWLGLDVSATGVMLGATIHDVAQVVGAGYSVSESAGNIAVIVKLFRVFLLMPVVLGIGVWFARAGAATGRARVPVPIFAFVFLALCLLNSIAEAYAWPLYGPVKVVLVEASAWGLLIAIAALGIGTSVSAIATLGWRHVATVSGTTIILLLIVTAALLTGV
jgi:uncharacterized integral membrane protein (TIGR00698 family)